MITAFNTCRHVGRQNVERKGIQVRESKDAESKTLHCKYLNITEHGLFVDVIGWTPGINYSGSLFQDLLLGNIQDGALLHNEANIQQAPNPDFAIDTVIFVVDVSIHSDAKDLYAMKQYVQIAAYMKKTIIFVVSKVDSIPELASAKYDVSARGKIAAHPTIKAIKTKIREVMGDVQSMATPTIFEIINYDLDDSTRLLAVENTVIAMMDHIVAQSTSVIPSVSTAQQPYNFFADEDPLVVFE